MLLWMRVLHLVGLALWLSGLVSLALLLLGNVKVKAAGILADIGATFSILSGIYNATKLAAWKQGWLHLKLGLVIALIAVHVVLRVRTRNGRYAGAAGLLATTLAIAVGIICVVVMR